MSDQADAPAVKPTPLVVAEVLVWDVPVRVFHWLLVFSVAGAWLSAESERWRWWHETLGYTTLGLMAFRLVWGWVGTRHARFADFVRSPAVVWAYVLKMVRMRAPRHVGHNPLGAWAVLALIALTTLAGATGWLIADGDAPGWLEEAHELAANALMATIAVHVLGVLFSGWLHRENLVRAMLTGRKRATADQAIPAAWAGLGVVMVVAVSWFWWSQR
jgi:cytochrome b